MLHLTIKSDSRDQIEDFINDILSGDDAIMSDYDLPFVSKFYLGECFVDPVSGEAVFDDDKVYVVLVDLVRLNPDMYDTCDAYYTSPYNQWRRKI